MELNKIHNIFLSYAWGGESELFVNELDKYLLSKGLNIIRDKRDLKYKGLITKFMQMIGKGDIIVAIISDRYLKSPNCMYELIEVGKQRDIHDRVFPILLEDAKIFKPVERIEYVKYWDEEIYKLNAAFKDLSSFANTQGFREDIDLYTNIRATIANITDVIRNMNILTPSIHLNSGFEELYASIETKISHSSKLHPDQTIKNLFDEISSDCKKGRALEIENELYNLFHEDPSQILSYADQYNAPSREAVAVVIGKLLYLGYSNQKLYEALLKLKQDPDKWVRKKANDALYLIENKK